MKETWQVNKREAEMNTNLAWYLLERNGKYIIVCLGQGSDPLLGHDTWNLKSGPFYSWKDAEAAYPDPASVLGSMTSERKAASSQENGKKGGRPKRS